MATTDPKPLVLVTGGSGFIGSWTIIKALAAGYRVRTTIRSLTRSQEVRSMITAGGATNTSTDDLTFAAADLNKDDGWTDAVQGCTYVLHVASPFPPGAPTHEDALIVPAREGTLRVLRAARAAGVKRVVVTSSVAAIIYGAYDAAKVYDEADWTPTGDGAGTTAYQKSKAAAERAAWEFAEGEGKGMELSVVNPGAVLGPVLGKDYSTSIQLVERLLNASVLTMPGSPRITFNMVDVRDVADLHLLAMTHEKAVGERFMGVVDPPMSIKDIAMVLREKMGKTAKRVPKREIPDFAINLAALWDPAVAYIKPELSKVKKLRCGKATEMLGWKPMSPEDSIVATAESLVKHGLVKP